MNKKIYSIKEITNYIKNKFNTDKILNNLWLTGEISNFYHHNSGHMYFTLKDKDAKVKTIMFNSNNRNLKFKLEDGLKVIAHGYINIYPPKGDYQFYLDNIEPEGKGALFLAFEQLKKKLKNEGLFDNDTKKSIPLIPGKIGLVTSPTGAALRDIISVIKRRFANVSLLIVPSHVQGKEAAGEISAGIDYLNKRNDIDVIIIARGGGSIEELWPFNEEIVAKSVYKSRIPIISGVGHETDFTIADYVADLRAPTPSAAAEMVVANRVELKKHLNNLFSSLISSIKHKIKSDKNKLKSLAEKRAFKDKDGLFANHLQRIDDLSRRLNWSMEKIRNNKNEKYQILSNKLDSLSPLKTFNRGFSYTLNNNGETVKSIKDISPGDIILTKLKDGTLKSKVLKD